MVGWYFNNTKWFEKIKIIRKKNRYDRKKINYHVRYVKKEKYDEERRSRFRLGHMDE